MSKFGIVMNGIIGESYLCAYAWNVSYVGYHHQCH